MAKESSLETITLRQPAELCAWEIEKRRTFGWEYDANRSNYREGRRLAKFSIFRRRLTFTRPADIPNREKLNELEAQYEKEEAKREFYVPIDPFNAFLLFLLLIFPGIIYIAVKLSKKSKIEQENALITEAQKNLAAQAKQIISGHWGSPNLTGTSDGPRPKAPLSAGSTTQQLAGAPKRKE